MIMNKYTIKQKVILEAFSMGYKEGTLMNVKVTLLDSDKNVLGIKADKTPTDKNKPPDTNPWPTIKITLPIRPCKLNENKPNIK